MKTKWKEEYKKFSEQLSFKSKLAAFLIVIFTFLSLYDLLKFFREYPQYSNEFIETMGIIPSSLFHLSVGIVFASRFALLFSQKEKAFWINQIVWLIGISILIGYWIYSRPPATEVNFGLYSTYPDPILANGSHVFGIFVVGYLFLSIPFKFTTLILSIIKFR